MTRVLFCYFLSHFLLQFVSVYFGFGQKQSCARRVVFVRFRIGDVARGAYGEDCIEGNSSRDCF
jgi:hypothetical protein